MVGRVDTAAIQLWGECEQCRCAGVTLHDAVRFNGVKPSALQEKRCTDSNNCRERGNNPFGCWGIKRSASKCRSIKSKVQT